MCFNRLCTEYVPARFGAGSLESYSVFSLVDPPSTLASDQQPPTLVVSMFVHTELPSGLLLVLANSSSQYLRVWLEEGRVKVQLNGHESVRGEDASADGRFRLLTVEVWDHVAVLTQAGHTQASVSIRPVNLALGTRCLSGACRTPGPQPCLGATSGAASRTLGSTAGRSRCFPSLARCLLSPTAWSRAST